MKIDSVRNAWNPILSLKIKPVHFPIAKYLEKMDARNAIGDTSLTMKDSVNPSTAKLSMMKINVKNA